jgi:hypothetical protein
LRGLAKRKKSTLKQQRVNEFATVFTPLLPN